MHSEWKTSDVFLCFETIGALIRLVGPDKSDPPVDVTLMQFLQQSLKGKLIYSAKFQPFNKSDTFIRTYKIMPRSQNAHAYINAGFRVQVL